MKICIDPGHGGRDSGAVSGKVKEKDVNLAIAQKLLLLLYNKGHDIIMTRSNDIAVSLYERANKANNFNADIFVSIHNNAVSDEGVQGTETLFCPGSRQGERLARLVQDELVKRLKRPDRGIKSRSDLVVLRYTTMPAILVECAFLTNPVERKLLQDNGFQHLAAEGIAEGIDRYFREVE